MMVVAVDQENISEAAAIHSASWQESHRSFCSPEFIALHTPQHQEAYLREKMDNGSKVFLMIADQPVGVVSVTGNLIEDLYILPDCQHQGFGTRLLHFAMEQCDGVPTLWILENNKGAEKLYRREGFRETGRKNNITDGLDEIEFSLG